MHGNQRRPVEDEVECAIEGFITELVPGATDHDGVGALWYVGAGEIYQIDPGRGQVRGDVTAAQQCRGGALEVFAEVFGGRDRCSDYLVLGCLESCRAQRLDDRVPRAGGGIGEHTNGGPRCADRSDGFQRTIYRLPRHHEYAVDIEQQRRRTLRQRFRSLHGGWLKRLMHAARVGHRSGTSGWGSKIGRP